MLNSFLLVSNYLLTLGKVSQTACTESLLYSVV